MKLDKKSKNGIVIVPSNITSIEEDMYCNNDFIKKMILHDNVESIEEAAFYMCSSLKKINLPNSIKYIGKSAFDCCTSLEKITIPAKVKEIKSLTFSFCRNLNSVSLPEDLEIIENRAFENCSFLSEIKIPKTVKYIGDQAFKDCCSIKSIEIPDNIKTIQSMLFYSCYNLRNVKLPSELEKIFSYSFCECKKLKSIELPKTLTYIGNYAFHECKSLSKIEIPDSVTEIGRNSFSEAKKLSYIKLSSNLSQINDCLFYNCKNLKEIIMQGNVKKMGINSFYNCKKLESISIPSTVSYIGLGCFTKCRSLKKIDLSNNIIKKIEDRSFSECSNLREVIFPKDMKEIGDEAFSCCRRLEKIIVPEGTTKIGQFAFYKCDNLREISLPRNITLSSCAFGNLSKCKKISLYNIDNLFEDNIYTFLLKSKGVYIDYETGQIIILGRNNKEIIDENKYTKINFKNLQNIYECNKLSAILLAIISKNNTINFKKIDFAKSFINYLVMNKKISEVSRIIDEVKNTSEYKRLIRIIDSNVKLKEEEYYDLFKFATSLGAFADDSIVRQKACNFIENLFDKNKLIYNSIHDIFSEMEYGDYNSEWTNFVMNKKNIDILLRKDEETAGYIARVYNEFFAIKEFYRRNKGNQSYRNVTIDACDNYFSNANFIGVTLETIDIAPVISLYTKSQAAFTDAKNIRTEYLELKKKGEIKDHILNEELKEKRTMEDIEKIKKEILKDTHAVANELDKIANERFTYEFLSKYDPANFILGKYCSCCAHLESVGYGIMHASIVVPNCQNLVIRNGYGRIIAKSTLYVNREQGYGVFNTIEVNDCLEKDELKLVYEKFKKAVYDFAEKYNEENEIKLTQINVGMSMNDLSYYIRNNDKKGKVLKAIDFSKYGKEGKKYMGDWYDEQYIVWKK